MERDKIKEGWSEYIQELYARNINENLMKFNNEGPEIMKEEAQNVLKKMKSRKLHDQMASQWILLQLFKTLA